MSLDGPDVSGAPLPCARHVQVRCEVPIVSMKVFKITGTFQMGRFRAQPFVKEVAAEDDARAREVLYSDIGSKHGTPRRRIAISTVVEVPPDQVESGVVRAKAGIQP